MLEILEGGNYEERNVIPLAVEICTSAALRQLGCIKSAVGTVVKSRSSVRGRYYEGDLNVLTDPGIYSVTERQQTVRCWTPLARHYLGY